MDNHAHLIIEQLLAVVKDQYLADIDLVLIYGSMVTNQQHRLSDLDILFVPHTDRGYQMMRTFILDNIGYDFWPMSWDRLSGLAQFNESMVSILAEGQLVYARNTEVVQRFNNLKTKLLDYLPPATNQLIKMRSPQLTTELKCILFDLTQAETLASVKLYALSAIEKMIVLVAYYNQQYVLKGLEVLTKELSRFSLVPDQFQLLIDQIIHSTDINTIKSLTNQLYQLIVTLLTTKHQTPELHGYYEELKSTYNKIIISQEKHDYYRACAAAKSIDQETNVMFGIDHQFPRLLNYLDDLDVLLNQTNLHEQQLLDLLQQQQIPIRRLDSIINIPDLYKTN
jgi:hypothetical protein